MSVQHIARSLWSCETEHRYPLNGKFPLVFSLPSATIHPCVPEFDHLRCSHNWNHSSVSFCYWLTLPCIMLSGLIHSVAYDEIFFFEGLNKFCCVYVCQLFYSWSTGGCQLCFFLLSVVKNAAMNMGVYVFLWDSAIISFGYIPRSKSSRSYVWTMFNFLRKLHMFLMVAAAFYILTKNTWAFSFFRVFTKAVISCLFFFCFVFPIHLYSWVHF